MATLFLSKLPFMLTDTALPTKDGKRLIRLCTSDVLGTVVHGVMNIASECSTQVTHLGS